MRCSNCGSENPREKKFCGDCGVALARRCAKCGAENPPEKKFCGDCGNALALQLAATVQASPAERNEEVVGERRQVTVLFSDLVGSTEISARLDPEEWRELVAEYHRAAAEAITRFGGHVAQLLGDGVMAYFGWPEAHENGAERAARAGLAIVDAVVVLHCSSGRESLARQVRVGIHTGAVVVGATGGKETLAYGETPNVAARVQAEAEVNAVVISAASHRLVSGLFVVEELGAHQLKGIAEPVELFRIVRLSGARNRLAVAAAKGLTPFVGREDELRLIWNRWERASEGEGQMVLITGEAGIGKSRLLRQFRKRLAGTPHTWNECAGAPYFQNTPFYPVIDMLQQGYAQRGKESDGAKLNELEQDLGLAGLKLAEAVPLIAPMLNLVLDEKYPRLTLSPEQQRKRLLTTLAEWLFGASRTQALVMAVEDVHWFDASTLELMQLLVEQGATSSVLLLYTARPEFLAPWTPRAHHTHVILNRLTARDAREMVVQAVATTALSGEAIDKVIERTGGVPLFVEELTRAVLERGDAKPAAREIPATLHDSLMARLDRLGRAKEVAQIASVVGREFSYELLQVVSSMPEDGLRSALARLAEAELIYAHGIPPEATYTFKHALIQDAAYEALLKSRRRDLHRRVAVAITENFPEIGEVQLEVVARHWTDAAEVELAIAAWRRAGNSAFERRAFKEAEEAYRRALEILRTLEESAERDGRELDLMSSLVQVLQFTRGWNAPEAVDAADRARVLAERNHNLAQHVLQVFRRWAGVVSSGDLAAAIALADLVLDLAEREGSPAKIGLAHVSQVNSRHFSGDLRGAEEHFARGAAFFEAAQKEPGLSVMVYGFASHNAWLLGLADTARDRISRELATAREIDSPFQLAFAQFVAAMLQLFLGDPGGAQTLAGASITLSDQHGFPYIGTFSRMALGRARANSGSTVEGVSLINNGIAVLPETDRNGLTLFLNWLAEAQTFADAIPDALVTIEQALEANLQERAWRGDALRIRGELRLKLGQASEAEADFRAAIASAQKIGTKALELRGAIGLGRMLKDRHEIAKGRDLLEPLYASFTEGFDTADLKDAKALLDELGG